MQPLPTADFGGVEVHETAQVWIYVEAAAKRIGQEDADGYLMCEGMQERPECIQPSGSQWVRRGVNEGQSAFHLPAAHCSRGRNSNRITRQAQPHKAGEAGVTNLQHSPQPELPHHSTRKEKKEVDMIGILTAEKSAL
jgi:hypothetical protein